MHCVKTSTPRFIHTPGKLSWMAATMLDFPERGVSLASVIRPVKGWFCQWHWTTLVASYWTT